MNTVVEIVACYKSQTAIKVVTKVVTNQIYIKLKYFLSFKYGVEQLLQHVY
jgi:hypothetical protein